MNNNIYATKCVSLNNTCMIAATAKNDNIDRQNTTGIQWQPKMTCYRRQRERERERGWIEEVCGYFSLDAEIYKKGT